MFTFVEDLFRFSQIRYNILEHNLLNENSTVAPVRYSKFAKTMHWGFVLLFAYGVFKQVDSLSELADPSLFRLEIVFAGIFILLLIIRFIYVK